MNKRDRVMTALNGGTPDRIPAAFWFHFTGEKASGQSAIDAHIDYFRQCGCDMMKIMSDSYFDYAASMEVKTPADWYKLKPLGTAHPFYAGQIERAREIAKAVRKDVPVYYTVFAPFSSIRSGYGDALVMRMLKENPDAVMHALDVITEDTQMFMKAVFDAGVDGIYYSVQGGEKNRLSVADYRRLVTPSDKAALDYANTLGNFNILHCCGWAGDQNNVEDWKDYQAAAVNWAVYVEKMDINAGRVFFPNVRCILGGLDNTVNGVLYKGTDDEVKAEIRRLCETNGSKGYILGADCSIPSDTPYDRIRFAVSCR